MLGPVEVTMGVMAPTFTLPTQNGEEIALGSFQDEKNVVLYFYPEDETPGCTVEACAFRDAFDEFKAVDTVVLGVSLDEVDSHEAFARNHELPFPLLSDADAQVSKTYSVYAERLLYGEREWGIERTTFLIDKRGIIRHIWRLVKVENHARDVLEFIRTELA